MDNPAAILAEQRGKFLEALAAGLVSQVVADGDVVDAALAIASRIAALPPLAVEWHREVPGWTMASEPF